MISLPRVAFNESFSAQVTVCCVCFDDWCESPVVGAIQPPLTLYPYRVCVALFVFRLLAGRAVIVFAQ